MTQTLPKTLAGLATTFLLLWAAASGAQAAALPEGELEQRCWLSHSRERTRVDLREPTAVYFANLRDGYRVASPFLVQFAVRGMGVAPAGVALPSTGHHHILVDRALPVNVAAPIPFDDSHRHFGKGQTSALLDLKPGRHTLRLLFADHEHRPHFVYSREIAVIVQGPRSQVPRPRIDATRFEESCAAWYEDEVSRPRPPDEPLHFTNIRSGETLVSPFVVRFGVEGFGVCAKGATAGAAGASSPAGPAGTGRFLLEVLGGNGRPVERHDLVNGATQVNLFIAAGDYRLRLRFVGDNGNDLLPPRESNVTVRSTERL